MPRYAKIVVGIFLGLALIIAIAVTLLATFNWNHVRPWANQQLSELVHRRVAIEGDLIINWVRPVKRSGWEGWLPWPEITARQIRVGQPSWTRAEQDMGHAGELTLLLDPTALFAKVIRVASLELHDADLDLVRTQSGSRNWTLTEKPANDSRPAQWQFTLLRLAMTNVNLRIRDPAQQLDVHATLDSLDPTQAQNYRVGWSAQGRYKEGVISGTGKAGGLLSLQQGSLDVDPRFPVQASLRIGDTTIQLEGVVVSPIQRPSIDLQLQLKGASMADLNPLFRVALPNTPAFQTQGRLTSRLTADEEIWRYENFEGSVGSSDLSGTVNYHVRAPRSFLTGSLHSELLHFKDLGPLIGLDKREQNKEDTAKQPRDKALPVDRINTESWGLMDADVRFKGKRIVRNENLPLDNVQAHVKLENKILTLTPLNFGVAGGTLRTTIELNGREPTIRARLEAQAEALQLRKLLRGAESMRASLGTVNAAASLTSQGESLAQLLGKSNGEFKAVVTRGTVSHFLLEAAGLNIADMVIVKLFGDEQIVLNCLAADFVVKNGLMHTKAFKLDTEDASIDITGTINLSSEKLDLDIDPENKSLRIFTLRTPLYVRGTFKDPDIGVHEGPIAARAGAAVALGTIATPLAAVAALMNLGTDDSDDCTPLMKAASGKTEAPAPGKTK